MTKQNKILIFGYGNPGRQDDGLGIAFSETIEKWADKNKMDHITCDSNYQLNIEDAELISNFDLVLFADASVEDVHDFTITRVECSTSKIEFSMHAVSPAFILDLCNKIYKKSPETYLLHLKGYEWDFKEGLTRDAENNLNEAVRRVKKSFHQKSDLNELVQVSSDRKKQIFTE
jgi:hydrogenase maturation protease